MNNPSDNFMKEFHDSTFPLGVLRMTSEYGDDRCLLEMIKNPLAKNEIHFGSIQSFDRNKGNGTKVLNWICELADKHQVILYGSIEPFMRARGNKDYVMPLNKAQLKVWYKKNGFKVKGLKISRKPKEVINENT